MSSILVTGGAGFIGSHICLILLKNNYKVFVIDSFINSSIKSLLKVRSIAKTFYNSKSDISIYSGDIRDKKILRKIFSDSIRKGDPIKGVFHLAGLKSVSESIKNPKAYIDNNFYGTIGLIKIMSEFNCRTFVYSSSATIYGLSKSIPFKEDAALLPINPYGETKKMSEVFLDNMFIKSNYKWRIASLRYFNPIGAHHSGEIGECNTGLTNNIFPIIVNTALKIQNQLKIFGKDWPTEDGTPIRDYLHVMDLAESHLRTFEYLINEESKNIKLNIGTGKGTSVLELIKIFERVNKVEVPYIFASRRDGDTHFIVADNQKAKEVLKWSPKRGVEDMCKDGWKWTCLHPDGF